MSVDLFDEEDYEGEGLVEETVEDVEHVKCEQKGDEFECRIRHSDQEHVEYSGFDHLKIDRVNRVKSYGDEGKVISAISGVNHNFEGDVECDISLRKTSDDSYVDIECRGV